MEFEEEKDTSQRSVIFDGPTNRSEIELTTLNTKYKETEGPGHLIKKEPYTLRLTVFQVNAIPMSNGTHKNVQLKALFDPDYVYET